MLIIVNLNSYLDRVPATTSSVRCSPPCKTEVRLHSAYAAIALAYYSVEELGTMSLEGVSWQDFLQRTLQQKTDYSIGMSVEFGRRMGAIF